MEGAKKSLGSSHNTNPLSKRISEANLVSIEIKPDSFYSNNEALDNSSHQIKEEIKQEGMDLPEAESNKFNKRISLFVRSPSKGFVNKNIDPREKQTLVGQAQSKRRLETIGEVSNNFDRNNTMSSAESFTKNESFSQHNAHNNFRVSSLNKDYIRYEQAIKQTPVSILLICMITVTLLVRLFYWIPDTLTNQIKSKSTSKQIEVYKLYHTMSMQRSTSYLSYSIVIRSAGLAKGITTDNR